MDQFCCNHVVVVSFISYFFQNHVLKFAEQILICGCFHNIKLSFKELSLTRIYLKLREEVAELKDELKRHKWIVDKISNSDTLTKFFTGWPTFSIFCGFIIT